MESTGGGTANGGNYTPLPLGSFLNTPPLPPTADWVTGVSPLLVPNGPCTNQMIPSSEAATWLATMPGPTAQLSWHCAATAFHCSRQMLLCWDEVPAAGLARAGQGWVGAPETFAL